MAPTEPAPAVVCDAGPLIHLDEIDCLDLLSDFTVVWVTEDVWREVEHHRPTALRKEGLDLQRVQPPTTGDVGLLPMAQILELGAGEVSALSWLNSHHDAVFLTDDATARLAAESLGYRCHGTIGVLLRSIRRGQRGRHEVVKALRELPSRSTLHIRSDLLAEIIQDVQEDA